LLNAGEIHGDYEEQTGKVICERFRDLDPLAFPGVLVAAHGPFTWGRSAADAVQAAVVLEYIAQLARETLYLQPGVEPISQDLLDRHYLRKHGPEATYGQGPSSGH
jgi:L-ribulose-5-phosphate 4-epimerase